MIDFHYIQRPARLQGFIRRGDFVSLIDDDDIHRVFMKINRDGNSLDPADFPEEYFEFGKHSESASMDNIDGE